MNRRIIPDPSDKRSIAKKSVKGSAFSIGSSLVTLVLGFTRSVLLARLLRPEDFGVFALAVFFMGMAAKITPTGINAALIHRDSPTSEVVSAHFILRIVAALLLFIIAVAIYPVLSKFYPDQPLVPLIMVILAALRVGTAINSTPQVLLSKQLEFKRIATLDVVSSLVALVVAGSMAWTGAGVWSLVGEVASGVVVRFMGLWVYRSPWTISLKTRWEIIRWYLRFAWFAVLSSNLSFLLDRFDDFWTGTTLGSEALGFYSKAYEFARYPRRVIANPVAGVFFSTFAKLQDDRERLSKAFFRVCSLIARAGFLFAGAFAMVTPEFIRIFLGDQWLPVAFTFQLMLVYTLLDPLLVLANKLTTAMGAPQALTKIRFIQMIVFVPAVVSLAYFFDIEGVAVAADLMLLLGLTMTFSHIKRYVDFSPIRMLGYPLLALMFALAVTLIVERQISLQNAILTLMSKLTIMGLVYSIVLVAFERKQLLNTIKSVIGMLTRSY
jgi:PST family polysaccharide transporter/lipopolysaccharide exporter